MKAIVLREFGQIDHFRLEDMPDPTPGPGEVVVRLRAAALNHRDLWISRGKYPNVTLPAVLGSDGAGQVASLGEGVEGLRTGQDVVINPSLDWGPDPRVQGDRFRILGMPDHGTFAELIAVPAENVVPKPAGMNFEDAAAIPLAGLTAYRAVVTKAEVQPGETVLVTGIGAGTATLALQFALALGARVFVTSGSEAKLERARALGAKGGVSYRDDDWPSKLRELAGAPDVVIDSAGGEGFGRCVDLLRPGGRLVTFGGTAGPVPSFNVFPLFWKQLRLLGTTMGTAAEFAAMLDLVEDRGIRPVVDRAFPLAEATEALRHMEQAGQFGKIVMKVE
ncbi:zinc-binding dehydrogenase [Tautonia plasticadhaerens]|uniref:Crotonyl-CoA reductase n=1 Tax=Tautonia plasticadhaerens TaxID=2527974 RepID=A0A518HCX4_9BACT|nr:zinc-binding dehydrogenase [Tautonia plasticadhaerens]QDV38718.1 Crotonyl-CoA reductase [Tautonia plasticadhaerens]